MSTLNDYEASEVREIALWKSERPSLLMESYRGLFRPLSRLAARVVPKGLARKALAKVEAEVELHDAAADILKAAGASEVRELRALTLEECDRLAATVCVRSEHLALLEAALPAIGGNAVPVVGEALAAVAEVPLLLEAAIRAVRRIGHCYGFPLDSEADHRFVMAILDVANDDRPSGPEEDQLQLWSPGGPPEHRADGSDSPDAVEESVIEDLPLEAIPIVGDVSNLVLDYAFVRRADITARRIFQERRLREDGKVESIPPSLISRRRSSVEGAVRIASEVAYVGTYGIAFGVTFPAALAGSFLGSIAPDPVRRGFRDGASAATRDSKDFREGFNRASRPASEERPALAPSTA